MYNKATTTIWSTVRETGKFPSTIVLQQGLVLSFYLFALSMYEFASYIDDDVPWHMMFAYVMVLVDETKRDADSNLEITRDPL